MYLLSSFLCAYAGFAALCAVTARNVPLVWTGPPSPGVVTGLRAAGYSLLIMVFSLLNTAIYLRALRVQDEAKMV